MNGLLHLLNPLTMDEYDVFLKKPGRPGEIIESLSRIIFSKRIQRNRTC